MKLSKLFGKFFIALVVPSLMLSSCALIGLEEEDDDTTETASSSTTTTPTDDTTPTDTATPTVDTSGADPMTFGSYSYTSFTGPCFADGSYYMKQTMFLEGTDFKESLTISTDANCSVSAGSTVTLNGTEFSNPATFTYSNASINTGSMGTYATNVTLTDADGNSVTSGFYILSGNSSGSGRAKINLIVVPKTASKAHVAAPGDPCKDNSGTDLYNTSQCTLLQTDYTLSELDGN